MQSDTTSTYAWLDAMESIDSPAAWGALTERLDAFAVDESRLMGLVERYAGSEVKGMPDAIAYCLAGKIWSIREALAGELGLRFVEVCGEDQSLETVAHLTALVGSGLAPGMNRTALSKLIRMCVRCGRDRGVFPCEVLVDLLLGLEDEGIPLCGFDRELLGLIGERLAACSQFGAAGSEFQSRLRRVRDAVEHRG